jgi:hypothetical protein
MRIIITRITAKSSTYIGFCFMLNAYLTYIVTMHLFPFIIHSLRTAFKTGNPGNKVARVGPATLPPVSQSGQFAPHYN